MPKAISESMEDYLEAIFHIVGDQQVARPKDIGKALGVTGPSVTKALHWLANHGLVNYAPFELITLTDKGMKVAREVVRRHVALRNFFINVLAIDEKQADEVACKMEHSISTVILERLTQYAEFVQTTPFSDGNWINGFDYLKSGPAMDSETEQ